MASDAKSNKKKAIRTDGFLETLRELGSEVAGAAAKDMIGGVAQETVNQILKRKSGDLKPNQPLNMAEIQQAQEQKEKQYRGFRQDFLGIRYQEKLVWSHQEQETKLQIKALLEELKKVSQATTQLAKEVKIATIQAPVEPGVYHLNFFERLRQTILLFRKRIEESSTWLTAFNQKAKKKSYYWGQVQKSGTKFMLSQERYMSTQAG